MDNNSTFTLDDDRQIRETFLELRKACFDLEKEKFKRMQQTMNRKYGLQSDENDPSKVAEQANGNGLGIFENWKKILILAVLILIFNIKRLANLIDIAFYPVAEDGKGKILG